MYLIIALKTGIDAKSFINEVIKTIKADRQLSNPEFKTWKVIPITDKQKGKEIQYEVLSQKETQLENVGCLLMLPSTSDKIRINFCPKINFVTEEDQIAMYLCRCAMMLRNHFPESIDSMKILDL